MSTLWLFGYFCFFAHMNHSLKWPVSLALGMKLEQLVLATVASLQ